MRDRCGHAMHVDVDELFAYLRVHMRAKEELATDAAILETRAGYHEYL